MKSAAFTSGLSDFHKMIITVLKATFPKGKPKVITYRDFSKYTKDDFSTKLNYKLQANDVKVYDSFEKIFLEVLNTHAPCKKKVVRANQKPYVTKKLRKAIMKRSYLENKYYKYRSEYGRKALRKQKNYCNRLYKRERKKYYSQLNLNNITDNKKFWNTMKPLFSNKGGNKDGIVLVNDDKIISDDTEVAQTFNDFFKNSVSSLNITENKLLLTETEGTLQGAAEAIKKI